MLRETRVRRIVAPMIAGDALPEVSDEDLRYITDLGLFRIDAGGGLVVANPTYREVILRSLANSSRASLRMIAPTWLAPEGRLDADRLLTAFLEFWREHGEALLGTATYPEIAPHLVLMAFLHRVENGGGVLKAWRDGRKDPRTQGLEQLDSALFDRR